MKMNQKKHLGFALGVATAIAIAVTGCSSTSGGSSSGSGSNSSSKQVDLSVTWWGGQARNDATIKVTDMYTKEHPNVHFTNSYQSFDGYFDKLSMLAAAGNMPDVFQFTVGQATGSEFITKGLIQPLDSYVSNKELDLSHFGTSAISTGKLNGKLYGVVLGTNSMCLAVDPSAYTKAGLTVPKDGYATWDDLGKDLVKLKAALGSGSYGADDVLWLDTVWGYWCEQHGEHAYTSKGDNIGFTQKTYVDYMNLVKSWMTQGLIPPLDVATTAASDPTNSELAKHKSAMDIIYTNNFENLQKAFGSTLQIVSLPGPNAAKATGVLASQHFVMSSKSANKDEAAKFISYFVNNVDANKVLNAERGMPASTEVLTALRPTFTSNQQAVSDYLEQLAKTAGAVPPPAPANSQSIYTLMDNLTQQIIYGKTTAEAAYQQIASTAKSQLASK